MQCLYQPSVGPRQILVREDAAPDDDQIRAGLAHLADVVLFDAAVHLHEAVDERRAVRAIRSYDPSRNSWPE